MNSYSVSAERWERAKVSFLCWALVAILSVVVIVFGVDHAPGAEKSSLALLVLVVAVAAAAIRPVLGLYSIVFFTLVGDGDTATWFPFAKNLSSRESLLYLSDSLFLSPLEVLIAMTTVFWLVEMVGSQHRRLVRGPLFAPVCTFSLMVVYGYFHGFVRGGDMRIAVFEGRSLFALPIVYLLTINLCRPDQLRRLVWTALVAIELNALLAINYWSNLSRIEKAELAELGEHAASVHFAAFMVLTFAMFLYRGSNRGTRILLALACIPIINVFLLAQRRAGSVALAIGIALVVFSLAWRHRVKFLIALPVLVIGGTGYVVAFWNSTSELAVPAQAFKTVISSSSASEEDQSSNSYRVAENLDLNATIRAAPVEGFGFGKPFLRPVALPELPGFEFYEYIPHNSILWIWIKIGFIGFVAMLAMFAMTIRAGVQALVRERDPTHAALVMLGVAYVAMFAVFAFVDIAWDPRSIVMLALSMALCTHLSPPAKVAVANPFLGIVVDDDDDDLDDQRGGAALSGRRPAQRAATE